MISSVQEAVTNETHFIRQILYFCWEQIIEQTFASMLIFMQFKARSASAVVTSRDVHAMMIAIYQLIPVLESVFDSIAHFLAFVSVCNTKQYH